MQATTEQPGPRDIEIPVDGRGRVLQGSMLPPPRGGGMVVFAHGSGSSRFSRRNRYVASRLQASGLGTLLMDLLTEREEAEDAVTARLRFDIPMLASRVVATLDWLGRQPATGSCRLGLFGSSTGAAAALIAAAERPEAVATVVSRGGRPDLAGEALPRVACPVLLIVGERDDAVMELNESAAARLGGPGELRIVASDVTRPNLTLEVFGARAEDDPHGPTATHRAQGQGILLQDGPGRHRLVEDLFAGQQPQPDAGELLLRLGLLEPDQLRDQHFLLLMDEPGQQPQVRDDHGRAADGHHQEDREQETAQRHESFPSSFGSRTSRAAKAPSIPWRCGHVESLPSRTNSAGSPSPIGHSRTSSRRATTKSTTSSFSSGSSEHVA
jgi:dienelactone hydrolase